jgi:YjbE family integral membrane protein
MDFLNNLGDLGVAAEVTAFLQVVMIDLVLAGDNAVAVGLAAAGLPAKDRRKAIVLGLGGAVVMLISFALIAVKLLAIIGLLFAGGILLLWVCWKMWNDLHEEHRAEEAHAEAVLEDVMHGGISGGDPMGAAAVPTRRKTLGGALLQILLADISMSLDNVLAVAGAAREHPRVLIFGLTLSITLMGVAATWIAKLLVKWRWLGYVGLLIVLYVALHMIWEGHREVAIDLGHTADYNAVVPGFMEIGPQEEAEIRAH